MQKKIHTTELDIPYNDSDCWERYPKQRWMYDLSRLLDVQHISWSPYETTLLKDKIVNMFLVTPNVVNSGYIYINHPVGERISSEVYIIKGEIKLLKHIDKQEPIGNIELRINAFVSLHFQKFTGIVSIESIGSDFMSIRLRSCSTTDYNDINVLRLIKKIYKKTEVD